MKRGIREIGWLKREVDRQLDPIVSIMIRQNLVYWYFVFHFLYPMVIKVFNFTN